MSESLPVELNAGSVHAIDAPERFTARGPFHLELTNEGGAVHVHVHLGDDLSRAARLRDVNHYVESGETVRVPVGMVPGRGEVTGHVEIVSGYGAERERVEVTVTADARRGGRGGSQQNRSGDSERPRRNRGADAPTGDSDTEPRTVRASSSRVSTGHSMERSATGMGVRGLANRSLPGVPLPTEVGTREGVAFAVLAAVAVVIGLAVILTVGDLLLSLVVAGVVVVIIAAAGWLLLGS